MVAGCLAAANVVFWLRPGKLTAGTQEWMWMVQMIFPFKGVIFRFHVKFPGVYSSKIRVAKGETKVLCVLHVKS